MQNIKVQTTQNIEIEYETASVGDRILAYLIDLLLYIAYGLVISLLFAIFEPSNFPPFLIVVIILPVMLYHLIIEVIMQGQSIGKKQMKIKVVRLDGSQPSFGNYLLRWMLRMIDISLGNGAIALLTIILNGKGQRLGDIAAGTSVVKMKPRVQLQDTIHAMVEEDYNPVFLQANKLSNTDVEIIKEILNSRHKMQDNAMLYKLVKKLKEVLAIETELAPIPFLKTLIKDYNFLNS